MTMHTVGEAQTPAPSVTALANAHSAPSRRVEEALGSADRLANMVVFLLFHTAVGCRPDAARATRASWTSGGRKGGWNSGCRWKPARGWKKPKRSWAFTTSLCCSSAIAAEARPRKLDQGSSTKEARPRKLDSLGRKVLAAVLHSLDRQRIQLRFERCAIPPEPQVVTGILPSPLTVAPGPNEQTIRGFALRVCLKKLDLPTDVREWAVGRSGCARSRIRPTSVNDNYFSFRRQL
ncbi:MAG: hypothetical protein FD140_4468 [Limisphaerales bacterium]|nr:MAG: hypothetical protein FD140_4468 [Limisphaerales bacterium]